MSSASVYSENIPDGGLMAPGGPLAGKEGREAVPANMIDFCLFFLFTILTGGVRPVQIH